jgi:DNA invertase Pin-like site-specific DNA recombinase
MAQLGVALLALFAQMERTYAIERAAHARAVAASKGRTVGRPSVIDPDRLSSARRRASAQASSDAVNTPRSITVVVSSRIAQPHLGAPPPVRCVK